MGMIKHRGDTHGVKATIVDEDGVTLVDPDNHSIQVYDPDGTPMLEPAETNPNHISLGIFKFYYNIPTDAKYGDWAIEWYADKGTFKETEDLNFTVEEKKGD